MFGLPLWVVALAVAMAGNAALGWAWMAARDGRAQAAFERNAARSDAMACTDAVNGLSKLAMEREAEAKAERETAQAQAGKLSARADRTLSKAPSAPGDALRSLQALGDDWLRERGQ